MTRSRLRGWNLSRRASRARPCEGISEYRLRHLQRRAVERLGVHPSREDFERALEDVLSGRAQLVGDIPHGAQAWKVQLCGREALVAVSTAGRFLTILFPDCRQLVQDDPCDGELSPAEES